MAMSRTRLSPQRLSQIKKTKLGRILIFCEGETEKCYFDYFAGIIQKNKDNKYTDIEVVLENAKGNAKGVLNYATAFMENEENNRKFSAYGKYLVFDCDDPPNIQSVIQNASNKYELLISNLSFEIWLLMHFENINQELSNRHINRHLKAYLHGGYKKGKEGILREIIQNGNIEKAIDCAKELEEKYRSDGKTIFTSITEMNPYTSVYKLIEQFMLELSQ